MIHRYKIKKPCQVSNTICKMSYLLSCSLKCDYLVEHGASNWLSQCWMSLQVKPGDADLRHRSHQRSVPEGARGQAAGRCSALLAKYPALQKMTKYLE